MNEQEKYEAIKKLVESNGNKKRASVTLDYSVRTINRPQESYQRKTANACEKL